MTDDLRKDTFAAYRDELGHMQPPWIAFPDYERHCMGWRMGPGDGYVEQWYRELKAMKDLIRKRYCYANDPPKEWEDVYDEFEVWT